MWVLMVNSGIMKLVTLDKRGRLTLPAEIRSKIDAKRFMVVLEGNSVRLIPLPHPSKVKGSLKIPWTIQELEEAGEEFVLDRA